MILEKLRPKPGYDLKKTLKTFWRGLGYAIVLAVLTATIKYLSGLEGLSAQEALWIGLAIAVLSAIHNAIKHWHDE